MVRNLAIYKIFICLLFLPAFLLADTVLLRNGQRIEGKIVGQSRTTVRIRTAGGTRSIPKANVRRIVYGGNDAAKAERERKKKEREERLKKLREKRKKELEERKKQEAKDAEAKKQEERDAIEAARKAEEERLAKLQDAQKGDITLPGALVRSALLPGLGQVYQDRGGAGAAYMSAFFVLGAGTGAAIAHHEFTRKQYLRTANEALIYTPFFFDLVAPVSPINSDTLTRDQFSQLGLYHQLNVATARAEMIQAGKIADASRTALLAFYLWNLADVFLFHPGGDNTAGVGFFITPETAALQIQFRF